MSLSEPNFPPTPHLIWASKMERFKDLPYAIKILATTIFLSNTASFMAIPVIAIYLSVHLEFSGSTIGLVLALYFISNRILPALIGPLIDRSPRNLFLFSGLLLRAAGFGLFAVSEQVWWIIPAAITIGVGGAIFEVAAFSVFNGLESGKREKSIVLANMGLNAGVIIGPVLGAGLSLLSPVFPFVAGACVFVIVAFGIWCTPDVSAQPPTALKMSNAYKIPLTNKRFLAILLVMFPWFFLFSQLFVTLPLSLAHSGGSPEWSNSVFVINGVVGLVVLFLASGLIERSEPYRVLVFCYGVAVLAFLLPSFTGGFWLLVLVVVLFSVAEVVILPAAEIEVTRTAPKALGGTYFGLFNAVFGLGGAIGHSVGSYVAVDVSLDAAWKILLGVSLVGLAGALFLVCPSSREVKKNPV